MQNLNSEHLELILNSINTPIVIINEKTQEYEWMNDTAKHIIQNLKIHFHDYNPQFIINNQLYNINTIKIEDNKKALILELINQSFIDNETELLNFQGFFIKYETLYNIMLRKKKNFYISLIEIDMFENLIKNFSYEEVIKISRKIASIIKSKIRNNIDIISKYNPNNFLLLTTEVDKEKT